MPKPRRPGRACASGTARRRRLAGELADRLDHAEKAARRAGLPTDSWPPLVLLGKLPSQRERVRAHERRALALVAEAEVLELHHHDHGIVVVGLHEVDVGGRRRRPARRARRGPCASRRGPSSDRRRYALWRSIAPRSTTYGNPRSRARSLRITRNASAPAHGITQSNRWIGSEIGRARHVLVERQRLLEQSRSGSSARCCAGRRTMRPKSSRVAPKVRM